jgi:hypothetical protein
MSTRHVLNRVRHPHRGSSVRPRPPDHRGCRSEPGKQRALRAYRSQEGMGKDLCGRGAATVADRFMRAWHSNFLGITRGTNLRGNTYLRSICQQTPGSRPSRPRDVQGAFKGNPRGLQGKPKGQRRERQGTPKGNSRGMKQAPSRERSRDPSRESQGDRGSSELPVLWLGFCMGRRPGGREDACPEEEGEPDENRWFREQHASTDRT